MFAKLGLTQHAKSPTKRRKAISQTILQSKLERLPPSMPHLRQKICPSTPGHGPRGCEYVPALAWEMALQWVDSS